MNKIYIGIDNGTTGSIGIIGLSTGPMYIFPPTKIEQDYTKKAQNITRMDYPKLVQMFMGILTPLMENSTRSGEPLEILALIERPFVNPMMFRTSICAVRAYEATVIMLESLGIPWEAIDSKSWQKPLLPEGLKGAPQLKKASKDAGIRLFPMLSLPINKHKDADGLLIAEWGRRVQR